MHVSIDDFWKLAAASKLLSPDECALLHREFQVLKGADSQANARSLAQWLVAGGKLTRYQASLLVSGRSGPLVLGPYAVTERIANGRLARLFRATHDDGRRVLLVFLAQLSADPQEQPPLAELARAAATVKNPHVSRTYGVVEHPSQPFIVLEGLVGETVAEALASRAIARQAACRLGFQAALGLAALHAANQVHGSVCPANVWLDAQQTAKLLAFPLVEPAQRAKRQAPPLVDYLAPELADPHQRITPAADIYGLGATLYELLAARRVFSSSTDDEKTARLRAGFPPRLDQLDPTVPHELADLLAEMLTVDPTQRLRSATLVAQRLAPFATSEPAAKAAIVVGASPTPAEASGTKKPDGPAGPVVVIDPANVKTVKLPRRRRPKTAIVGVAAALAAVAVLAVAALLASRGETPAAAPAATANDAAPPTPSVAEASDDMSPAEVSAADHAVDDDGKMLWASPTSGQPLELAYLPDGGQLFFILRLAELLDLPEGQRLLAALGPGGQRVASQLRDTLGVELADVQQLTVAFVPDESFAPRAAYVMRLARDVPQATLMSAWGHPRRATHESKTYFAGAEWAYYFPASGDGRVVALAPPAMMQQILTRDGPPLLRSGVEQLLRASDDARQVNVLFTPSYLLTDGRSLLVGHLADLRGPMRAFLDERIAAVLVSAHLGPALFVELRAVAPIDAPPLELLEVLQSRWEKIPERVETHVAALQPHPHGRLLINRLPRMLQLARDFTRGGVEDGQVVLRAYLPANAAHNLVMAADLTLLESSGVVRQASPSPTPTETHNSVADVLRRKISLSFPRESLDRALDVLAGELGVEIVILGSDLQLEGITKNQSLNNLDERDQPADAILRKMLKLANPDGKLVYVIKPCGGDGEAIFITTRQAAAKRRDTLPAGF